MFEVTPTFYRTAAELAGTCGWSSGTLGGQCTDRQQVPCCINGHLMNAGGFAPSYDLYLDADYRAVVAPVLATIAADPTRFGCARAALDEDEAQALESWNDTVLYDYVKSELIARVSGDYVSPTRAHRTAATRERELLLATADRLEREEAA